jgi:PAS domain S-box-containing protein
MTALPDDRSLPLALLDDSPNPLSVLDTEWRVRYINHAGAEQVGRTVDTLLGRVLWDEFPDAVGTPFHDLYHRVMRDRVRDHVEAFFAPLDRWFRVEVFPAPVGIAVFYRDVTDNRRTLDALWQSRQRLEHAQRIARIGSWWWDVESGRVEWSSEVYRLFGLPETFEPDFGRLESIIHPADWPRMRQALDDALTGRRPYDLELRVVRADGRTLLVRATGEVLRSEERGSSQMLGTVQDVTEARTGERRLAESRALLARTHKLAGVAAWAYDPADDSIAWEPENWPLWRLDPATFTPTPEAFLARVVEADRRRLADLLASAAAGETTSYDVGFRGVDGTGEIRHFRAVGEVETEGDRPRVVGLTLDETDRVRAAEERRAIDEKLQQAQRLESLGVLAGGIAHDFNNLLVGVLGNVSLGLAEAGNGPMREFLLGIESAAQRAAELTRQLLAYSGKGRFVIESIDLSVLVRDMTALIETALLRKARLHLGLARGLPAVEADVTQLRQIVMNLLTNGAEALGDGEGEISLRTGVQEIDADYAERTVDGASLLPGRYVYFEVSDNGVGIAPDAIPRIFEPFYTTKFTGRGLGLAATLGIVRSHRGGIKVYSELGRGTTVKVLLPALDTPAPTREETGRDVALVGAGTVLVVDDEPSVRRVARSMLERRGFAVVEAADGAEALRHVEAGDAPIRAVLLDLTMPGLSGHDVFRRIKAAAPSLPVVMMSGYNEQNVTQQFVGKGLAGFVQKPFRASELYEKLAAALATGS